MKKISIIFIALLLLCLLGSNSVAQAQGKETPLAQQEVTTAITRLISVIEQDYIHQSQGQQAIDVLTQALNRGEFNGHFPYGRLKIKLESMLFAVTKDSNFALHRLSGLSQASFTDDEIIPGAIQIKQLETNTGYLAVDGDFVDERWRAELDIAMAELSDNEALIIDLRSAGMSSMAFAQHFLSYFWPSGELLSEVSFAHNKRVEMVSENVVNRINEDTEVYVVTSPFVAGPWEFVAYTLQQAGRATIVGQATIGLSFMTVINPLSEHLSIEMANAQIINPHSMDNWQDEGVIPDINSDAKDAVAETLLLIGHNQTDQ